MTTPIAKPADPQLASWCEQLGLVTDQVQQLIRGLSSSQLQWRPGPGKWSIAECLSHLALTAGRGAVHWRPAIATARQAGGTTTGPFSFGWLGGWFVRFAGPSPKRPATAPAIFLPPASIDADQALADFTSTQTQTRSIFVSADGLDLERVKARSAVTPLVRFNLATWFASTVAHEQRHFDQIRRVRNDTTFPAA